MSAAAGPTRDVEDRLTGMSFFFPRLDIEQIIDEHARCGFDAIEIHVQHVSPGVPVPLTPQHGRAVGEVAARAGLRITTLNAAPHPQFTPHLGREAFRESVDTLVDLLRMADAMRAARVLVWDGVVAAEGDVKAAARSLAACIGEARDRSELERPPLVSIEMHPFTFALQHGGLAELAEAVVPSDAVLCLDFCHCAVALGRDFIEVIPDDVFAMVGHIHFSDSDARTSELHFPVGAGVLDLNALRERFAGTRVPAAWDLFGWPGVRAALHEGIAGYREFVTAVDGR
jgi:sugar phosphate isomerase/epimerase